MSDDCAYKVVGYTDSYFQQHFAEYGNSICQYSLVAELKFANEHSSSKRKTLFNVNSLEEVKMRKTLFNANSLEEVKMKLAIFGLKLIEPSMKAYGFTFVEYDVEEL